MQRLRDALEMHFRSLEYDNERLSQSLDRSEKVMHACVWKMRTSRTKGPCDWKTRSDLESHLGALAILSRQRGGGRVFSKQKHSFFDHEGTVPSEDAQPEETDEEFENEAEACRKAKFIFPDHHALSARIAEKIGGSTSESSDEENGKEDNAENVDESRLHKGWDEKQSKLTRKSGEKEETTEDWLKNSISTFSSRAISAGHSYQHSRVSTVRSRPQSVHSRPFSRHSTSRPDVPSHIIERGVASREMNNRAAAIVGQICQQHEEVRQEQKGEDSGSDNLFAGMKDKFNSTFDSLADLDDQQARPTTSFDKGAARFHTHSRPSTSPAIVRPKQMNSSSASKVRHTSGTRFQPRHTLPPCLSNTPFESFVDLKSILAIPPQIAPSIPLAGMSTSHKERNSTSSSQRSSACLDLALSQIVVSVKLEDQSKNQAQFHPQPQEDINKLLTPLIDHAQNGADHLDHNYRDKDYCNRYVTLPRPVSVHARQREVHMKKHFISFLALTEPQLWPQGGAKPAILPGPKRVCARSKH